MEQSTRLTLEAAGITLIGVILSIGLTVGFGLKTDLWIRVIAASGTAGVLVAVVKLSSSEGAALRRRELDRQGGTRALNASEP